MGSPGCRAEAFVKSVGRKHERWCCICISSIASTSLHRMDSPSAGADRLRDGEQSAGCASGPRGDVSMAVNDNSETQDRGGASCHRQCCGCRWSRGNRASSKGS